MNGENFANKMLKYFAAPLNFILYGSVSIANRMRSAGIRVTVPDLFKRVAVRPLKLYITLVKKISGKID